jgi:hypothetical protein
MICKICKEPSSWVEFSIDNQIGVCSDCKDKFTNNFLIYCTECDSMCFIPKTMQNIKRLQFFMTISHYDLLTNDIIVPQKGCPHCVTFKNSVLGEPKHNAM